MKWFLRLCLLGLLTNLLAWCLPADMRPYHMHHWIDDWRVALVEHTTEFGMGPSGMVRGRFSTMYSGGNVELISHIRQNWRDNLAESKTHWPIDSQKVQYDEWGPSHIVQPDGIDVTEVGVIYSVPYSLGALVCAGPLVGWLAFGSRLHKPRVAGILD